MIKPQFPASNSAKKKTGPALSLRRFALQRDLGRFRDEGAEDFGSDVLLFTYRQVSYLRALTLQPKLGIKELDAIFEAEHDAVFEGSDKAKISRAPAFFDAIADQLPARVNRFVYVGDRLFDQCAQFVRQRLDR
jgi:hypothetical protein